MPTRKLKLDPQDEYQFKSNEDFRADWTFLPNWDAKKVISQQLTYLKFHEWLQANLKVDTSNIENVEKFESLTYHIIEGFRKTHILGYASICEMALFAVLQDVYTKNRSGMPAEALACFIKNKASYESLGGKLVSVDLDCKQRVTSNLYVKYNKESEVKDSERDFAMLIKGAEALTAIGVELATHLDALRDQRNHIHLQKHILSKEEAGGEFIFPEEDVTEARNVCEALRLALQDYKTKVA